MDTRFNLGVEEKKVLKFFVDWVEVVKGRDILNVVVTVGMDQRRYISWMDGQMSVFHEVD